MSPEPPNPESFRDQVERLISMSRDNGETWDLSVNDQAALKAVLQRMAVLDADSERLTADRDALQQQVKALQAELQQERDFNPNQRYQIKPNRLAGLSETRGNPAEHAPTPPKETT